jgi:hypothetical protein
MISIKGFIYYTKIYGPNTDSAAYPPYEYVQINLHTILMRQRDAMLVIKPDLSIYSVRRRRILSGGGGFVTEEVYKL